jgi:hypothetical protein
MRSLLRVLTLASVLAMLLLPPAAYADDPPIFYTSTTGESSGTGTFDDPWPAPGPAELTAACQHFGAQLDSGEIATLYWILDAGSSVSHFQYNLDNSGTCVQVEGLRAGPPPGGVTLTPPVIVGGLIALGLLALGAAWLLHRRLRAGVSQA